MESLPSQLVRTRRFTLGEPTGLAITGDGRTVLYLRSQAGDDPSACLWALDVDSGEERVLADPVALSGRSATLSQYAVDGSGEVVAFALDGRLWMVRLNGRAPQRIRTDGPVVDPRPDPTGRRIAYVASGALRVVEGDGKGDRAVVVPDGPDVTFGTADLTGETSVDGPRGYWWSPDGDRLMVARVDSSAVQLWHIPDSSDPTRPPRTIRYAAAGTTNPAVTLWILGLDGAMTEIPWDHEAFEYLVGAGWDAHGPYAVVQSRDQRTVQVLGINPVSGETTLLAEQHDPSWVQLIAGLPARSAAGALVAHVDQDGTRHLTVDGEVVTPAGLQVRSVLDAGSDDILFTASEEPTETHLWTWRAGVGVRRVSTEPGVHSAVQRGDTLVHVVRAGDRLGAQVTVERHGMATVFVRSFVEAPALEMRGEPVRLGPRELRGRLYLPSGHSSADGPLPVLLDPYGGAGRQQVTAELDWRALVSQWFAEQGFAVLAVDGAGTPGRGPDWEREVDGDLFGPVLEDQVAALHEAARLHPELDLSRVGIRGWSFGGALAALAVLRRPDVFHAAVAGAGVSDQRLYNTHWRERFLGHPDEFPERYDAASLVQAAPGLTRPLLLIHGLADENVHVANSVRFSEALLAAGREHELLLLPGVGHQAMGVPVTESLLQNQLRFLQQHLQ
ncbi:S9 family peptidase [Luteipulveratus mongoliensis]|uniref:S9 family peptidase n=1 Tax=Luteipulveratus mongoliensis TaxID=571913 RepID=UPI001C54DB9D|nr:prolyl oligopeptidase family serine peptidase [Luteipulveratus mongoliensis]